MSGFLPRLPPSRLNRFRETTASRWGSASMARTWGGCERIVRRGGCVGDPELYQGRAYALPRRVSCKLANLMEGIAIFATGCGWPTTTVQIPSSLQKKGGSQPKVISYILQPDHHIDHRSFEIIQRAFYPPLGYVSLKTKIPKGMFIVLWFRSEESTLNHPLCAHEYFPVL